MRKAARKPADLFIYSLYMCFPFGEHVFLAVTRFSQDEKIFDGFVVVCLSCF